MLEVYQKVKNIVEDNFSTSSEEFKKGCATVIRLFEQGIKKTPTINAHLELRAVRKELENAQYDARRYKLHFEKAQNDLQNKTEEYESKLSKIIASAGNDFDIDKSFIKSKVRRKLYAIVHNQIQTNEEKINELKQLTNNWWDL